MGRVIQSRGTGLIEAVIATAVVVTAFGALAALASVAVRSIMVGRDRTLAVIFAQSKLEELRATPHALSVSPDDALERDVDGWHERLDSNGRASGLDNDAQGTVFSRRWRVGTLAGDAELLTVVVRVGRCVSGMSGSDTCTVSADAIVIAGVRSESVR